MIAARQPDDAGLGLVEVVVAMLLFAVLAMAILPLALRATTLSAGNRDAVSANAFASGQLATVRARFPDDGANSCTSIRGAAVTAFPDPAGSGLVSDIAVDACPGAYPDAVTVTVTVREPSAPPGALVSMATKIVVTAP